MMTNLNVPFKIMQSRVYKIRINMTVSILKVGYDAKTNSFFYLVNLEEYISH